MGPVGQDNVGRAGGALIRVESEHLHSWPLKALGASRPEPRSCTHEGYLPVDVEYRGTAHDVCVSASLGFGSADSSHGVGTGHKGRKSIHHDSDQLHMQHRRDDLLSSLRLKYEVAEISS